MLKGAGVGVSPVADRNKFRKNEIQELVGTGALTPLRERSTTHLLSSFGSSVLFNIGKEVGRTM